MPCGRGPDRHHSTRRADRRRQLARLLPEVDVWVSRVQKESARHGQPYGNSDDTWAVVEPLVIVSLDHAGARQSDGGANGNVP
jgi:hypothetical protein